MLNDYGKSIFRPWLSVQNVTLGMALIFLFGLAIRVYDLSSGEVAGWVQAIGALISIWAAWSIARSQARSAEQVAKRAEVARCLAVIGVVRHVRSVIKSHHSMGNSPEKISNFRGDVARLISTIDKIDLLSLSSPAYVEAVCEIRQMLEDLATDFNDYRMAMTYGIHFKLSKGKLADELLLKHLNACTKELGSEAS